MADNYLEYRREKYEEQKRKWLAKKNHKPLLTTSIKKPDDEAL